MGEKTILLSEFLKIFEFTGKVVEEEGERFFALVDKTGVNLGDIEADRFEINRDLPETVCERLDIYIYDYITNDLQQALEARGIEAGESLEEMVKQAEGTDIDVSVAMFAVNPANIIVDDEFLKGGER